jgi:FkbM family methyltransferase
MTGAVRTAIERLSRGRRLLRHLPAEFDKRPIVVSPDAALRWLKPSLSAFDPELMQAARQMVRPGDVVWDIGANVGAFALAAAVRSARPVLCIEADPFLADLLRRTASLRRNSDLRLDVVCAAMGDRARIAEFAIASRGRAASGLAEGALSTQHGSTRQMLMTPVMPADLLLEGREPPSLVKVDIEGGEALFVDGASRLIDEVRPRFYIEISERNRDVVLGRFGRSDYDFFELLPHGLVAFPPDQVPSNVVCIPRSRQT